MVDQGTAGVALTCAAVASGFSVIAFDPNRSRIEQLPAMLDGPLGEQLRAAQATGRLQLTTEPSALAEAEIILICTPAAVTDDVADLSGLIEACGIVGSWLGQGRLVVIESAVFPGATEQVFLPLLEQAGCLSGRDFLLACSPTRVDGNGIVGSKPPKVVGGVTAEATGIAALLHSQLADDVVAVSSSRAAELIRLLDRAFHTVNTALVNELAIVCHESGTDVWEVLEAASIRGLGFAPFEPPASVPAPGSAAGSRGADGNGHRGLRLLEQAIEINAEMPAYVAGRIADALNDARKVVKGAAILVLGGVPSGDGSSASPAVRVMTNLAKRGARLMFHDPVATSVAVDGVVLARTELTERAIQSADCVALLGPGSAYDLGWLETHARLLFDARNVWGSDRRKRVVRL